MENNDNKKLSSEACMGIGLVIGMGMGLVIGIIFNKPVIFITPGFMIGFAIGRILQNKYGYKQPQWSELSSKQKRINVILIVVLAILVLAGIVTFFLFQ